MKELLARYAALLMKIGIVVCFLWAVMMLLGFWGSGTKETQHALASGKRFIIYTADGRVEGTPVPAENAPVPQASLPPPPPSEPLPDSKEIPAVQSSANPIVDVSEALLDKTGGAPLPKIGDEGETPWQYYSKSFKRQNEFPVFGIIITGTGHSRHAMELALNLDDRIGLGFSPYAANIASWVTASRMSGHEMYVELPLQTANYPNDDPGPYGILVTRSNTENLKNLFWAMSRFQGYVGLVAPPGEVVTNSADTFGPLKEEIAKRGVAFMMGRDTVLPEEPAAKGKKPLVAASADVWIDEELTEMSIQARLATLEQVAQRNGVAIGIARGYPLSILQIKAWQETLGSRNIAIVPPSFITKLKNP